MNLFSAVCWCIIHDYKIMYLVKLNSYDHNVVYTLFSDWTKIQSISSFVII